MTLWLEGALVKLLADVRFDSADTGDIDHLRLVGAKS